ncbi:hypothetical protein [Arthrobacter sp. B10-11]|uniref:hypothetical protein n=1 Tax=Arthrobacter sp. B10-11 TaxID=3081160 RepID=UPI00295351A0|nr:hypothetical protein [Arthrobacter sp. B10-11]MDV8146075.1 hypothetical protein [Arthrobacter sp. B10-11]
MTAKGWAYKVQKGDFVASTKEGGSPVRGEVEQAAPEIGVVWIREDELGERRMLLMSDLVPEVSWRDH